MGSSHPTRGGTKKKSYNWLGTVKSVSKPPKKKNPAFSTKSKGGFAGTGASFNDIYGAKNNKKTGGYHSPAPKSKKYGSKSGSSSASGSSGAGYGSGRSSSSGGSRGGGGGGRKGKGGKGGAGGDNSPGYDRTEAANIVQADINAQMQALLAAAQGQKAAKDYDISKINALFDRSKTDLDYLFNEAKDFNTSQSSKISQRFDQTGESLDDMFTAFKSSNETAVDSRRAAAEAELARLGIQQSGMGQFSADASNAASMADVNQTNAMANLATMKEGAGTVGDILQGMATGSHASSVGAATTSRNEGISQATMDFSQYMRDMQAQANKVKADSFVKTNDLMMQMQGQRFDQWATKRGMGIKGGAGKAAKKRRQASQSRLAKSYAGRQAAGNNLEKALGAVR